MWSILFYLGIVILSGILVGLQIHRESQRVESRHNADAEQRLTGMFRDPSEEDRLLERYHFDLWGGRQVHDNYYIAAHLPWSSRVIQLKEEDFENLTSLEKALKVA